MKKALSIALVLAMLLGIAAVAVSATPAVCPELTQYGYQNVEAHYFGGSIDLRWLSGKVSLTPAQKEARGYADGTEAIRDAIDDNAGALVIDGKIEASEWGDPVVIVDSAYAASNVNKKGDVLDGRNTDCLTPSAENTYFYNRSNRAPEAGLRYELYLMWDEDYFYVGVKTNDPDGPKQINGGAGIWDGDCVQMKIDPMGPNATCNGEAFVPTTTHYTSVGGWEFDYVSVPWSGDAPIELSGNDHKLYGDFMFSYVTSDGGRTEAYDAQARWNPVWTEYDYTGANDVPKHWEGYGYYDEDISILSKNEDVKADPCYAVVRWDNEGTSAARNDVATYEIAMPWSIICKDLCPDYEAAAGNVLGMSLCLLNGGVLNTPAGAATDAYNSYLSWGSGIAGYQLEKDPQTTAGNNAVTLSADPVSAYQACEHTFAAATCTAPETCTLCGYQRGYKTGHEFSYSDPVLPTASADGSLTGTCAVCGAVETYTFRSDDPTQLIRDFNESSGNILNIEGFASGYINNWYDAPASLWDDTLNDGMGGWVTNEVRKQLFNLDGTSKTPYDTDTFGYAVIDAATTGEGLIYGNGDPAVIHPDAKGTDHSGTYFELDLPNNTFTRNKEYGWSYDFYITDWTIPVRHSYYTPGVYTMFGGNGTSFGAGLYYTDDWAYIAIGKYGDLDTHLNYNNTAADFEADCMAFYALDREALEDTTWHTINYLFDSNNGIMMIYFDGEFACAAQNELFSLSANYVPYCLLRRFETPFYMKNVRVASATWTAQNYRLGGTTEYNLTIDGVTTQVEAGETVNLNAAAFENGYRFAEWEGDTSVLTLNVNNASFTMPEADVTLTSKYVLVGDANTDGKINAQDANFLSQIIVGSVGSVIPADINNDGKVNATDSNMLTKMITGTYSPIA